jgi:hypothetical protein
VERRGEALGQNGDPVRCSTFMAAAGGGGPLNLDVRPQFKRKRIVEVENGGVN